MRICQLAGCREPATYWVELWQYYVGYLCAAHAVDAERLGLESCPISEEDEEGEPRC